MTTPSATGQNLLECAALGFPPNVRGPVSLWLLLALLLFLALFFRANKERAGEGVAWLVL